MRGEKKVLKSKTILEQAKELEELKKGLNKGMGYPQCDTEYILKEFRRVEKESRELLKKAHIGCGSPLGDPFFVHHKCGHGQPIYYCLDCQEVIRILKGVFEA